MLIKKNNIDLLNRIHLKLTFVCCSITTIIVLIIILICLRVSEGSLTAQEESKFLNKANNITADLLNLENIDMSWYNRITDRGRNFLYIEADHMPIFLTTLFYRSSTDLSLFDDVSNYITDHPEEKRTTDSGDDSSYFCKYTKGENSYLIFFAETLYKKTTIKYIYIYNLKTYNSQIYLQRIRFFMIWVLSILILFIFAFIFSAHTLTPIVENQRKQKQFVTLASHELRSPLAVLKTTLSLITKNPSVEKSLKFHGIMHEEILRMEQLVNDLLFLSKAGQTQLHYDFDRVDMNHLLEKIYEKYLLVASEKQIRLKLDTAAAGQSVYIQCDRLRMEQVIIILLDNALSYTPANGSVTISASASRFKYCIIVTDTGPGISDADKGKIFDRFYQVNHSHTDKNHSGLGLSIAREICIAHKGTIHVKDANQGGSEFTVKLSI